jgi:signal transduction histidine kinase
MAHRLSTYLERSRLGLYVVSEIVEAHGGEVRVDACPGKGSTFTVELPLDRA